MSTLPLTVLLPVYNGEKYLSETIESVLSQSFANFEFVIIDDGSQDRTSHILDSYARHDDRLRLLRHDNQGAGYSLNRGLHEAKGDLIAQIGADDIALPGRFEKQVKFLRDNPDYVLVGAQLRIIDSNGRGIGVRKYPTTDRELRNRLLMYNPFGAPSVMYRREEALAAGSFTSRFWACEDYDFVLRLAKLGKVANLAEPLTSYRLHDRAIKSRLTLRQLRDTLDAKRAAHAEYGYPRSVAAYFVNLAEELLMHLPQQITYWLFRKIAIRPEHD
jgi:glycosyltransferase involved in cell wall biosynthesis